VSSGIAGKAQRRLVLGSEVIASASGAFAADTRTIFTISGGEVLITALWGKVTTSITVANTVALQANPTNGATGTIAAATDIGTTDTAAGSIIGFRPQTDSAPDLAVNGAALSGVVVSTGDIEQVTTGTNPDGAITWYLTYVPLTDGATVVAG
jgi:hypothetical protein